MSHRGEVVSEQTVGEVATDASGGWQLYATPLASPRGGMSLRVLFAGSPEHGACVSEPVQLATHAALSANPTGTAPAAGTAAPASTAAAPGGATPG